MRIKTQFIVSMLLFGVVLAAVSASAIITNRRIEKVNEQNEIVSSIAQSAVELSYMANEYLVYQEGQQLDRWRAKFVSFSRDVSRLQSARYDQQALIRNMQVNAQRLKDVFESVASAVGSSLRVQGAVIDPSTLQVSWSRIAVQSQELVSDASSLSKLLTNQVNQLQRTNTIVVLVLIGVFVAYLLLNYLLTQRRALKGLAKLQAGAAVIGSGNLDFRIEEKGKDEIGDLSRAVNRMTSDLKSVTASKDDLEKEIEERKKAEGSLEKTRFVLSEGQRIAHVGTFEYLSETQTTVWSDEECRIYGLTPGTPAPSYDVMLAKFIHQDDAALVNETFTKAMQSGSIYELEHRIIRPDGTVRVVYNLAHPYFDEKGNLVRYIGTTLDITERKKVEAALKRREHELQSLADNAPDLVFRIDRRMRHVFVNQRVLDITGMEHEEYLGRTNRELGHPPELCDLWEKTYRKTFDTKKSQEIEFIFQSPEGPRDLSMRVVPEFLGDSSVETIIGITRDITERKRAEVQIRDSLKEKEILLKEIHHRVKNNMQVISSLVSLQADESKDSVIRDVLQDVNHRVRSMAMVHEKLYQSADLAQIDFADYTQSLVGYLWRSQGPEAGGIELKLDLRPVMLPVTAAVPCGLILNELFSNALKHAFRGRKSGTVRISLGEDPNRNVHLSVRDDGVGFAVGVDWEQSRSLGLGIVQMLAGQIDASVEVLSNKGTEFKLVFEGPKK